MRCPLLDDLMQPSRKGRLGGKNGRYRMKEGSGNEGKIKKGKKRRGHRGRVERETRGTEGRTVD